MAHTRFKISLRQFEAIDSQLSVLLRAGPFETCADPRGYIATSNKLFDLCVEAIGYTAASDFESAEECAAKIVADGLLGLIEVCDEEAA